MWQYRFGSPPQWPSDSLMHYGISGQKWGVRRFQNRDGSLTSEGKERYRLANQAAEYYKRSKKETLEDIRNGEANIKALKKAGPDSAEKWLDRSFGQDWHDKKLLKEEWDIDDPIEFGKREARLEYDHQLSRNMSSVKRYRESVKKLDAAISKWTNVDINSLSKDDMKELREIDKYLKKFG